MRCEKNNLFKKERLPNVEVVRTIIVKFGFRLRRLTLKKEEKMRDKILDILALFSQSLEIKIYFMTLKRFGSYSQPEVILKRRSKVQYRTSREPL